MDLETREQFVRHILSENQQLRSILANAVIWFNENRPDWGPGTLPTWYADAAKLVRVVTRTEY
jgi:hypothetical protein